LAKNFLAVIVFEKADMGIGVGAASRRIRLAMAPLGVLVLVAAFSGPAIASTWSVTQLHDDKVQGALFGISCPSPSLCVATGSDSLVATSTNPTGGATAWKVVHPGGKEELEGPGSESGKGVVFPGAQIRGVSCPTPGLCVGASLQGNLFSSTNPTGGAAAWKIVPLGGEREPHIHLTGISCPAPTLCVAVAYGSKIVYSTDPTGERSAWTVVELAEPLDFRGVSCASVSFCVAVDNEGKIAASANPTGPASAWGPAVSPAGLNGLNGIACPSVSLCVTGNAGQIISSTNPTLGSSWNVVAAGTGLPVKGVSCPLVTACAAVDNNADVIVSTNPTGGASAWSFTNVIPAPLDPKTGKVDETTNGMFAISCPTTSLCAAAGQYEQVITFGFHAIGVGVKTAHFKCRLSGRHYRPCRSPRRYRVGKGTHLFRVRAIGTGGIKGPPTSFHFRVGRLTEPQPVGSCRPKPPDFPPGQPFEPCVNAR
jgi:hypothetical protein